MSAKSCCGGVIDGPLAQADGTWPGTWSWIIVELHIHIYQM